MKATKSENSKDNLKNELPNLVIIGAMKCGTSSLHYYLDKHPEIFMSREKELNFFVKEENWSRGLEWYKSNFKSAKIVGESSPNYTKHPFFEGVPERMYSIIPNAKLIYVVRDPIKRIVSHYIHRVADGLERQSFTDALKDLSNNHMVNCSRYYMQLERFLDYYPPSNILVINLDDLANDRTNTLSKVFRFLNVNPDFQHESFSKVLHESSVKMAPTELGLKIKKLPKQQKIQNLMYRILKPSITNKLLYRPLEKPVVTESMRQALVDALAEDVAKFRAFTGCEFTDWSL